MKSLGNKIFVLFLWIVIALIPISCGTRKAKTEILKNAVVEKESVKSEGEVKKKESVKEVTKDEVKAEKVDENKSILITELFSQDGVIQSRVKEIKIDKSTNNTSNNKESLKEAKNESYEKWKIKTIRSNEITTVYKTKTVSSDRNGLYYAGAVVAVIGLAFWFKPWMK